MLITLSVCATGSAQRADIGINSYAALDWARNRPFADAMKTARDFYRIRSTEKASTDAAGWPSEDAESIVFHTLPRAEGDYAFSCVGYTRLEADGAAVIDLMYDEGRNRTTATLRVEPGTDYFALLFRELRGGIQDIKLMRPSGQGSLTSYPEQRTFTDDYLSFVRRFSVIRAMDLLASNSNPQRTWSERVSPSSVSFHRSSHGGGNGWQGSGVAWEYIVQLANEAERDLWINVPVRADDDYIRQLARLVRSGTTVDGISYEGLRPDRKLYIEFSNEVWNSLGDFRQSLWNVEQAAAEGPASPLRFDGESDQYILAWRRVGMGAVRISNIFREELGDDQMMTRVRPVLAWQQQDGQATGSVALDFIDRYFGTRSASVAEPHPVNWFIWGGGGSAYYGPDNSSTTLTVDNIWDSDTFNAEAFRRALRDDALLTVAYGIERVAYEGGPSMDGVNSAEAKLAAWSDPRMTSLLTNHHDIWSRMNGSLLAYFADADESYQWAFVEDVLPPYNDSAKMRAIDALSVAGREPVRPTLGRALPVTLRGGNFVRSQPTWLLTAFGGDDAIDLMANRPDERRPDWLLYAVRSDATRAIPHMVEIELDGSSSDARLQVRWHGVSLLAEAVSGRSTLQFPVTVAPGVHGIVLRADQGSMRVRAVRVSARVSEPFTQVALGNRHSCALKADGTVKCWGDNRNGQLGDGTTLSHAAPAAVVDLPPVVELVSGDDHNCARTAAGAVYCWGWNDSGQLGDRTATNRTRPVVVRGVDDAVVLVAGRQHTCAQLATNRLLCWGANGRGQLGRGVSGRASLTPAAVTGLTDAFALAAGAANTCALRRSGRVSCWGENLYGAVGDGTRTMRSQPTEVVGLSEVSEIAAGRHHFCARSADTVRCWGWNRDGMLGDETHDDSDVPIELSELGPDVRAITAGAVHTCAAQPEILCWGGNLKNQLGDGTRDDSVTPVPVAGLPSAPVRIVGKERHTCAVLSDNSVSCWGENKEGALGDGTRTARTRAVAVVGL